MTLQASYGSAGWRTGHWNSAGGVGTGKIAALQCRSLAASA